MLGDEFKLQYRQVDVSYELHVNTLYEFYPMPGAQLKEITLIADSKSMDGDKAYKVDIGV